MTTHLQLGLSQVDVDGDRLAVGVLSKALEDALVLVLRLGDHDRPAVGQLHHTVIVTARVEVDAVSLPCVPEHVESPTQNITIICKKCNDLTIQEILILAQNSTGLFLVCWKGSWSLMGSQITHTLKHRVIPSLTSRM